MHNQWNRIENPELDSHIDGKIIFGPTGRIVSRGMIPFNQWCWSNWPSTGKEKREKKQNLGPKPHTLYKTLLRVDHRFKCRA